MDGIARRLALIVGPACSLPEASALTCAHAVSLIMHGAMTSPPSLGWGEDQAADNVDWILDRVIPKGSDAD
jgi:hypothetical protein